MDMSPSRRHDLRFSADVKYDRKKKSNVRAGGEGDLNCQADISSELRPSGSAAGSSAASQREARDRQAGIRRDRIGLVARPDRR